MPGDVLAAMQEAGARALIERNWREPEFHVDSGYLADAVLSAVLPVLREAVEGLRDQAGIKYPETPVALVLYEHAGGREWSSSSDGDMWKEPGTVFLSLLAVLALLGDGKGER